MSVQPLKKLKIFYCYTHEDQDLREELEHHLSNLKRLYHLETWFDRDISPGANWEETIDEHLNTTDLILLLISPDFMFSDYCYNNEMKRALIRHTKGEARVIPILLRPVHWANALFSHIQMLPTDAKPITRWNNRDEAFYDVTLGIERAIKELLESRKTSEDWLEEASTLSELGRYEEALNAYERVKSHQQAKLDRINERRRESRRERADHYNAYNREFHRRNPEPKKARDRKYREDHTEEINAYIRNYKRTNEAYKVKKQEYDREYRRLHPEQNAQNFNNRRARIQQAGGSFTSREWKKLCKHYNYTRPLLWET